MDSTYWCQLYLSVSKQNNGRQLLMSTLPFNQHTEQWTQWLLVSTLPFNLHTEQWAPAIGVKITIQPEHRTMDSSYWCQLNHSVCTQNNGFQLLISFSLHTEQWILDIGVNFSIQSALQLLVSTLPFSQHTEQWTPAIGVNSTIQSAHRTMDSSYWCQLYHAVCTQNNGLDSYWCQLYHSVCTQNNGLRLSVSTLLLSLHPE